MIEDTKYCVDCGACMTRDEMRHHGYQRDFVPIDTNYWCKRTRQHLVDRGPTRTCASMRHELPTTWGGCGEEAVLFVPKPQAA